jgi:hypothetical protein
MTICTTEPNTARKPNVPSENTDFWDNNLQKPPFSTLIDHWMELRDAGIGGVPKKSQFSPGKVKSILSKIQVFKLKEDGDVVYRLTGTTTIKNTGKLCITKAFWV